MKENAEIESPLALDNSLYTALPSGENAVILFQAYRKLLLANMVGYLQAIQSTLNIDISFIIQKYEKLNPTERFSPAIFELFSKLVECSSKGEVPIIIDVLHRLNHVTETQILDAEFKVSTILTESWELDFINKLRSENIPNKSNENTLILPILNPDTSVFSSLFFGLKNDILKVDKDFYTEIDVLVTRLKMFNGKALKASTSASVFGAIYLRVPPASESMEAYFADHIIHETSHLCLDILLAFDKIILNEKTETYRAPMRVDPRPMFGIFHATFVLSRMIRIFQKIHNGRKDFIERLDLFKSQFNVGMETVEKHALLTENGKRIRDSFIKTAGI